MSHVEDPSRYFPLGDVAAADAKPPQPEPSPNAVRHQRGPITPEQRTVAVAAYDRAMRAGCSCFEAFSAGLDAIN